MRERRERERERERERVFILEKKKKSDVEIPQVVKKCYGSLGVSIAFSERW